MTIEDASKVAAIHTRSWQKAYQGIVAQNFLDQINIDDRKRNWIDGFHLNPGLIRLVLEDKNMVQAFLCGLGNREKKLLPDCDCELWAIYCDPDSMKKGYGKALLDSYKEMMKYRSHQKMSVWTLKENMSARNFYERNGGVISHKQKLIEIGGKKLEEVAYIFNL